MQTTTIAWPASYLGVGLAILTVAIGIYQGVTQDGYHTVFYRDYQAALADIKAHIDSQGGK